MMTQRNEISILHPTGNFFATRRNIGGTSADTSATKRAKCWHNCWHKPSIWQSVAACLHDTWLAEELAELFDTPGGNGGGGGCPHPSGVPAPHPVLPVPVRWRHVVSRRLIWRVWLRQLTYRLLSSLEALPRSLLSHCWGMNCSVCFPQ